MKYSGKVWGDTREIFSGNNVEVHRIKVKKGGKCSKHKHDHKINAFYIESGRLEIKVWKKNYPLVDTTILEENDYMIVEPGEYHCFNALTEVAALEIYYVKLDPEDISRESVGELAGVGV